MRNVFWMIWSLVLIGLSVEPATAAPITTGTLVREMIDMRRLGDFPEFPYRTVQFSSYDHRSDHPGGPGWFANSDGFGNEPLPNFEAVLKEPGDDGIGEYLICDVNGPGAIVRVWTAKIEGTIRMFLDKHTEPVYDGPAVDFFQRTYQGYAKEVGLDEALLTGTFHQRDAAYAPIPFAKRCRIVWTGDASKIHFYQLQVRLYEPGAKVQTFQPSDLETYSKAVRQVANVLSAPGANWNYASKREPLPIAATVPAGVVQEVLKIEGQQALERLTLKVHAGNIDKALRQTILHIACDEYPWGQVQSPIGDLFGAAPGINPYDSAPFTVERDGTMTCRFVMPFAKSLAIRIENRGQQPVTVTGSALPMEYEWKEGRSMHFRARWRVDHDLIASPQAVQDMPYLLANGKGLYVGSATMLLNPNEVPSSWGSWWGEGDEKIFVDADVRPSTFGTGSEDYYNYSWSARDIFIYPYCGQPRNDGPANRGFVTNNRWHILDPLPFQSRIAFYMELYSHERTPGVSYARIGYHYARPGTMDDHVVITGEDVRHLRLPANWQPAARCAAGNSVFYQAEELTEAATNTRFVTDPLWSGNRLMLWTPQKKGKELTLTIPILEDGGYSLHLAAGLDNQSGRISATLDGRPLPIHLDGKPGGGGGDEPVDLYVPHRILSR